MQRTSQNIDPEAFTCPHHPNMNLCLISLHKNAAKRLFCIDCFDRDTLPLKKVISLSAINEHQERNRQIRLKEEDIYSFIKSALDGVDETFRDYIKYVQAAQESYKMSLRSIFEDILQKNDDTQTFQKLKQKLETYNKTHKLGEGPELESYLIMFNNLKDSKYYEELKRSFEDTKNSTKEAIKNLRKQLESLKQRIDTTIRLPSFSLKDQKNATELDGEHSENDSINTEDMEYEEKEEESGISFIDSQGHKILPAEDRKMNIEEMKAEPKFNPILNPKLEGKITCLSISLDGKWMVVASQDIEIYDLQKRVLYHRFLTSTKEMLTTIDISRDGNLILSTSATRLYLWSIKDKTKIFSTRSKKGIVSQAKFSYDSNLIATTGNRTIRIREIGNGNDANVTYRNDKAHLGEINHMAFHPNGRYLLTGGEDKKICCWNIEKDLENVFVKAFSISNNCKDWLCGLGFDQTGKNFMAITSDNFIKQWAFETKISIYNIPIKNLGEEPVEKISLVPGSLSLICSYHKKGTIRVWNIQDINHPVLLHTLFKKGRDCPSMIGVSQNLKYIVVKSSELEAIALESK